MNHEVDRLRPLWWAARVFVAVLTVDYLLLALRDLFQGAWASLAFETMSYLGVLALAAVFWSWRQAHVPGARNRPHPLWWALFWILVLVLFTVSYLVLALPALLHGAWFSLTFDTVSYVGVLALVELNAWHLRHNT